MANNPAQTGSFWLCPECRKHVPSRASTCSCGFDRERTGWKASQVRIGQGSEHKRSGQASPTRIVGVALVTVALGGASVAAWRYGGASDQSNQAIVEKFRRLRSPRVLVVEASPVPVGSQPLAPESPAETLERDTQPTDETSPAAPVPLQQPPLLPSPPPATLPSTGFVESETDVRRRLGAEDFARKVAVLSARADEADLAWHRYSAGCRENVLQITSSSVAVAAAGDRDWFAVAGVASTSSVTMRQWTDACEEMGTFIARISHVHGGMCEAEDAARRASVLPGLRREIRQRYRLEWWGWDHYCPFR